MAPHHRAVDVAAGHERACVSTDSSRRLDEPEERTPHGSSRVCAVTDAAGSTPIAVLHAALNSHPLERHPKPWRAWVPRCWPVSGVVLGRGGEPRDRRDRKRKASRTFRALVWKNVALKTRGAALLCFALELCIPVAFVLLMCLPRLLVRDYAQPAVFHRVAPLESLTWSRRPPSARAARLIFSPRTPAARAVAEAAGVTLVCGPDLKEDTGRFVATHDGDGDGDADDAAAGFASFAQQVAAAAALDVDLAAVLAETGGASNPLGSVGPTPSGGGSRSLGFDTFGLDMNIVQSCVADPVACAEAAASVVRLRPDPPIKLDSPLFAPPAALRAEFCAASCVDNAACRRRILDEFLIGVDTAEEAEALALGRTLPGSPAENPPHQPAMAVVSLPPDLAPRATRVEYVIRVNASDTPTGASGPAWAETKLVRWVVGEDDKWREYWTYVNVQRAFDQALISLALTRDEDLDAFSNASDASGGTDTKSSLPLPRGARLDVRVKSYPFPAYATNLGSTYAAVFFGLAFVFAFVIAAASMCQSVVLEKELRLRESMELMGMSRSAYWGSWFTTSYACLALVSFLVSVIGSYPFKHTDWTVTFAFLCVWSAQLVAFCFFLSACFHDAKVAAVGGALAYVLTWTPGIAAVAAQPEGSSAWLACTALMPASGVYMWGWAVAILENAQRGARWDTLFRNLLADDEASSAASGTFSAGGVLFVALANALAYGALAWAVDGGATPSRLAARASAFLKRFGRAEARKEDAPEPAPRAANTDGRLRWDVAAIPNGVERDCSAPRSSRPRAAVRVANVYKTFAGGVSKTRALDGLSFAAREGEITALLGHNGAGKTTALSILTGATRDFEGDAFVDGIDVKKHPERARASLGVCPQHDVLWPSLTAREHLELFARLREPVAGPAPKGSGPGWVPGGSGGGDAAARVAATLATVGLVRDADRRAGTLSGGQRRKLSLAIAFIGEPSVVLLDEPTAGMDPVSRRQAWDVIRRLAGKNERDPVSVLLTTHFMDEADALSDRVAVVHAGKLACVGSPLFVKARFGGGYVLRLRVRGDADFETIERVVRHANRDAAKALIFARGADAAGSRFATVALPSAARASFPGLLEALEGARGERIGVLECGVGCATLEDAFLNVAAAAERISPGKAPESPGKAPESPPRGTNARVENGKRRRLPTERAEGTTKTMTASPTGGTIATFLAQTRATFWKRAVHCRRTFPSVFAGTVLAPLLFAAAGLAASSAAAARAGDPRPASMLDRSFLGGAPIGVASSAGRHAFVAWGDTLSRPADPWDVVAFAGDALETLPRDGGGASGAENARPALAPFAGVDAVWDCAAEAPVLDACAHACAACGPRETTRRPADTLEVALAEKLEATVTRASGASTGAEQKTKNVSFPVFDAFASLDGALLAVAAPRATCAAGRVDGLATCASLFVEPGGLDTSRPTPRRGARTFQYTVLTSSTAYHALPAAMATTHDAIFRALALKENRVEDDDSDAASRAPPSLVSINHPLPATRVEKQQKQLLSRLLVALCVVVSLSALSASAAAPFPARETASGAKHLQIVSGMRRDAYWCGTFLWDVCAQSPTLAALAVVLIAGGVASGDGSGTVTNGSRERDDAPVVALVSALALFACSATPLAYLVGAAGKFASPATAVASTLALFVFFGVAQLIAGVTLGGIAGAGAAGEGASEAWRACRVAFLWLPHYCVGRVVFDVSGGFGPAGDARAAAAGANAAGSTSSERASGLPPTTSEAIVAMGVASGVYACLVLLIEHADACAAAGRRARGWVERVFASSAFGTNPKPRTVSCGADPECGATTVRSGRHAEDALERDPEVDPSPRVGADAPPRAALVVRGLRKKYRGRPPASAPAGAGDLGDRRFAVDDVTFDVSAGEAFALLGVNGAGKTTTFEMLTGALEPTRGDAYVFPRASARGGGGATSVAGIAATTNAFGKGNTTALSLRRDADAFRRAVGYCPQRDALFESLSAREHALFYGALRGLSREESAAAAERVLAAVGLPRATAARPAREYSGGNKRALAVAIALMGDPACVLLDEPSTGMDPRARRRLRRALVSASRRSGVAFVLTTHSMAEAEALCTRVGLVEAGVLSRVGDVDAWRAALGTGHALEMRLRDTSPARRDAARAFARRTFRAASPPPARDEEGNGNERHRRDDGDDGDDIDDGDAEDDDARAGLVKYRVPRAVPMSFVFRELEAHRDALGVEEYQVGSATLEETFLRFAGRRA